MFPPQADSTKCPTVSRANLLTSGSTVIPPIGMTSQKVSRGAVPSQECVANSRTMEAIASPSVADKTSSGSVRRSREARSQGTEKSQELSKKLVKALTEKILKRMNQRTEHTGEKTELDTAVSSLTSIVSEQNVPESSDGPSTTIVIEETPNDILENLPANLPVIEASNIDVSASSMVSYTAMTSIAQPHLPSSTTHVTNQCIQQPQIVLDVSTCSQTPAATQTLYNMENVPTIPPNHVSKHPQYLKMNSLPNGLPTSYTAVTTNPNTCINSNVNGNQSVVAPMYYYPEANTTHASYMFPTDQVPRPPSPIAQDRDIMLERYIQQQTPFCGDQVSYQYPPQGKESYSLKSPDSGYGEPSVSLRDINRTNMVSGFLLIFVTLVSDVESDLGRLPW